MSRIIYYFMNQKFSHDKTRLLIRPIQNSNHFLIECSQKWEYNGTLDNGTFDNAHSGVSASWITLLNLVNIFFSPL